MNQVIDVFSSTQCAAPKMTHALKLLGKGNMGNGIKTIFLAGCLIGVGTVAIAGGVVLLIENKKQAISCEDANLTSDEEVFK